MSTEEEKLERRRKASREYHRRLRATPEGKAMLNEANRKYYRNNCEKVKKQTKESYERHWGSRASYSKQYRPRRDADKVREQRVRSYNKSFKHALAEYRAGRITIDELNRRLSATVVRLNERCESEQRG